MSSKYDSMSDEQSDRLTFSSWQAKQNTVESEELFIKRKAELNKLVRKVIRDELNDFDRKIVELHWYRGMTKNRIAEELNVDRSTVHRHFTAINETVYEKLKYAIELIYGGTDKERTKSIINENNRSFSSHINSDEIAKRLRALRAEKCLTADYLSDKTGISTSRIEAIERKGSIMTMAELKRLTDFYKVSCNYIIFGTG